MDITNLKNLKPIDIMGLKNFRIFDDKEGFLEEFSSINILTGANNSGKSSIVKALQLLKNSVEGYKYPFDLDLNQQEHLLGDFDNILFNTTNRNLEISLPFIFMGVTTFYITLKFESPKFANTFTAKLRGIEVIDKIDNRPLCSFQYRVASEKEKLSDKADYENRQKEYKRLIEENKGKNITIFDSYKFYSSEPFENPLTAFLEWSINQEKLKHYLIELKKVYELYLDDKESWARDSFKNIDNVAKDLDFIPSLLIKSFKKDAEMEIWTDFVDNKISAISEINGMEKIGELDFDSDDFLQPPWETEHVLFKKVFDILETNLRWIEKDHKKSSYLVIKESFSLSWESMLQRISTINYISNIKEENARSYNASSNSPFIKLLKSYESENNHRFSFIAKYLKAFDIGDSLSVKIDPKYQTILVSITAEDGSKRELVDFGYGIKQLVLILMQISVLAQKNERSEHVYDYDGESIEETYVPSLLIIEEPESNLHPKWQSLLAEMFAEANKKFNIQFIIETHSEYLIRKFQTLVAKKDIETTKLKIFYLRKPTSSTNDKKQIESTFIREDGSIDYKIFDHGFFDQNYNLELGLLNVRRDRFMEDFENLKRNNEHSEEKLIELQQKIDEFVAKADVTKYELIITQTYNTSKLSPDSVKYLVEGEYLLQHINPNGDFSPVILQYGRAIENELIRIFRPINMNIKWLLGPMQGSLEKFKGITINVGACSNSDYTLLPGQLASMFHNPMNLKIELLQYLRDIRNSASHAGTTKSKHEAIDYIQNARDFLNGWIIEMK